MPLKPKAVCLDFATLGPDIDTSAFDRLADVVYYAQSSANEISSRLRSAQIAVVNKAKLSQEMLAAAPSLELIVVTATGTDNVDVRAARDHGITVANVRAYCNSSVVQHVFALVLTLNQHVHRYDGLVKGGAWQASETFALFDYPIRELSGRRLGIVGYGSLGRAVGKLGCCLGMELLISARPGADGDVPSGRVSFDRVVAESDVLSLHCPLTRTTRNLLGNAEFAAMQSDAIVVNTARGGLIDSEALIAALASGAIAGAGIDVVPEEPPTSQDPLLSANLPNLIITPHIAWAAREARQRALDQAAENIADYLADRPLARMV